MAAAFTPGPWMLATSNSWRRIVTQFDTREVCVPTKQADGHPDLLFPNPADAPLMIAAPDLLEAVQAFMALDPTFATICPAGLAELAAKPGKAGHMPRAVQKARAAIAKATGSTS